jgi:excisionase family DNA binding protein
MSIGGNMAIGPAVSAYPYEPSKEELELLTVDEVANILTLDESTIYKYIRTRELRAVRFGRAVRVRLSDLLRFIDEHAD